jgi:hypothetical protein
MAETTLPSASATPASAQENFWQKILRITAPQRTWLCHQFTQHPEATGETYLQHLVFTVRMAARLVVVGIVLLLHGIFPFLFTRTASHQLDRIWRIFKRRMMDVKPDIENNHGDAI